MWQEAGEGYRVIMSRMMRWAGHVGHMRDMTNPCSILVGKPEGKRQLKRPRYR